MLSTLGLAFLSVFAQLSVGQTYNGCTLSAHTHPTALSSSWRWSAVWLDERGGWWRLALTLALFAAGVASGIALHIQANASGLKQAMMGQPSYVQEIAPLIATLVTTGLGLIGCLLGIRYVHHRPIACVFTDSRPFGIGLAIQSAALWALLWFAFTMPLPGAWQGMVQRVSEIPLVWWPVIAVVCLAAMIVGRTTEEVLFRGYLLTRVAAWVKRPWLAVCIVAAVFTAVHKGNAAAYSAIAFFSLAWGAACVRAGTLAPMVGAHVTHDTLNFLLLPSSHTANANASTTWTEVLLIAVALCVWIGWLLWATRKP